MTDGEPSAIGLWEAGPGWHVVLGTKKPVSTFDPFSSHGHTWLLNPNSISSLWFVSFPFNKEKKNLFGASMEFLYTWLPF